MSGLTLKKVQEIIASLPPAPPDPFRFSMVQHLGTLDVTCTDYMPKEHIGEWVLPAHPLIRRLAKWFRFSPWVHYPMMKESDPIMFGSRIILSHRQWSVLKREPSLVVCNTVV